MHEQRYGRTVAAARGLLDRLSLGHTLIDALAASPRKSHDQPRDVPHVHTHPRSSRPAVSAAASNLTA